MKSVSQSGSLPLTPKRRLKSQDVVQYVMIDSVKAADKASNVRVPTWPWSMAINMLFTTQMTAVSDVEWNGR